MKLDNETKIKFCNAYGDLNAHEEFCVECREYLSSGCGDLCDVGKQLICKSLAFTDTEPIEVKTHPTQGT